MRRGRFVLGATLIEAVVSLSMLGLLMMLMFQVYRLGANAWQSGETDVQLVQSAQLITDRLSREAGRAAAASVALDPPGPPSSAVSFLSPVNPVSSKPDYDPVQRSPIWHAHSIFYHDAAQGEVRWKMLPLSTPTLVTTPLAGLDSERNGGILLSQEVTQCEFEYLNPTLRVRLQLERKRYGKELPDRVSLSTSVLLRN